MIHNHCIVYSAMRLLVLCMLFGVSAALPTGAPSTACEAMYPSGHSGSPGQMNSTDYSLTVVEDDGSYTGTECFFLQLSL